jgi:rubrerythrin
METTAHPHVARSPVRVDLFDSLGSLYLARLMRTARGRAFMLNFMVQAEEADEKGVFDTLLARVDDPVLGKMVRVHRDDETRHARMLKECLARAGVPPEPVPPELRIVERIDRHAGGLADSFVSGGTGIMEAYLVLQVIEERGVRQFPKIANAMRPFDPESAAVIDRITGDEERHVRYAKAISRRYAPDLATLDRALSRLRRAEARAFAEHSRAFLDFATARDLDEARGPERLFWRMVVALGNVCHPAAVLASSGNGPGDGVFPKKRPSSVPTVARSGRPSG